MADKVVLFDGGSSKIQETEAPGMWQGFYAEKRPFSKVSTYANDFNTWVADAWTVTEVGTSLQSVLDARNGILSLVTGGTENDGNNLQLGGSGDSETTGESWLPAVGKNLWFEISVASPAWTQHEVFFGLHIEDTSAAESEGTSYIGFTSTDGSAVVNAHTSSSAGTTSLAAINTPTDSATTFYKYGFKVTGTEKVEFYVNDVLVGTVTTTIPTTEMKLTISHTAGEASAKTLNVDYIVVSQER